MIKEGPQTNLLRGLESLGPELQKVLAEQTIREIESGEAEFGPLFEEKDRLQQSSDPEDQIKARAIAAQLVELFGPEYENVLKAWEKTHFFPGKPES